MTNVDPNLPYTPPKKGERRYIKYKKGMTAEEIFRKMTTGDLDCSPSHSQEPEKPKSRSASRKLSET